MAKDITNNELAGSIKDLANKFEDFASVVKSEFEAVHKELAQATEERKAMSQEIEQIQMRLTNVAYRFEIKELEQRMLLVEQKI
jgi:archaellum component FlaC